MQYIMGQVPFLCCIFPIAFSYIADHRNLQWEYEQRCLAGGLQSGYLTSFTGVQYKDLS